jgi:hypothetical protein
MNTATTIRTFYKLEIQGIVYLVDPVSSRAYTYDLDDPTEIGSISWTDPKANPTITLLPEWQATLTHKQMTMTHKFAATQVPPTVGNDDATTTSSHL